MRHLQIATRALITILTAFTVLACSDDGDSRRAEVADARELWRSPGVREGYVFVYNRLAPENPSVHVRVQVEQDRAIAATDNTGASAVWGARTIDDFFLEIEHWLDRDPPKFEFEPDPTIGYPRMASADFETGEDTSIGFQITCFSSRFDDDLACPNGIVLNDADGER